MQLKLSKQNNTHENCFASLSIKMSLLKPDLFLQGPEYVCSLHINMASQLCIPTGTSTLTLMKLCAEMQYSASLLFLGTVCVLFTAALSILKERLCSRRKTAIKIQGSHVFSFICVHFLFLFSF